MHIQKVLNSSVVLVQDDSGEESILLGKGIGYGRKAGEPIERQPSDRVFLPLSNPDAQPMLELFSSIPASYLELTHGIVAGLRVLPGVDDMEGDVACLFVRQLDAKLCLYLLQAALAHRVLLGIKMLDFPEDAVGHHKTLLLALHCKMQVIGQQQIDVRRKFDSQRLLCVVHNVLRQFQIGCRNAGKQLQQCCAGAG